MNFITHARFLVSRMKPLGYKNIKNMVASRPEYTNLKNAKSELSFGAKSEVYTKQSIDIVVNHYREKINNTHKESIKNTHKVFSAIGKNGIDRQGNTIKVIQSELKNNLQKITGTLAYLKNNTTTTDDEKTDYLSTHFSTRALNMLKETLANKDITTVLTSKKYNHLGMTHAIFEKNNVLDEQSLERISELIDKGLCKKNTQSITTDRISDTLSSDPSHEHSIKNINVNKRQLLYSSSSVSDLTDNEFGDIERKKFVNNVGTKYQCVDIDNGIQYRPNNTVIF